MAKNLKLLTIQILCALFGTLVVPTQAAAQAQDSSSSYSMGKGAWVIKGFVPQSELKNLRHEWIDYLAIDNKNTAHVLDDPDNFPHLRRLALTHVNVDKLLPKLTKYKKLEKLSITQNTPIDLSLLGSIKNSAQLKDLILDCPLLNPKALKDNLPKKLHSLSLININCSDEELRNLPPLNNLVELYIRGCPINGTFLKNLQAPKLKEITVNSNNLTGSGIGYLPQFNKLTKVELVGSNLNLSASDLAALGSIKQLEHISLEPKTIDRNYINLLCNAKRLKVLYIDSVVFDSSLVDQLVKCSCLERLRICTQFPDEIKAKFMQSHPKAKLYLFRPK